MSAHPSSTKSTNLPTKQIEIMAPKSEKKDQPKALFLSLRPSTSTVSSIRCRICPSASSPNTRATKKSAEIWLFRANTRTPPLAETLGKSPSTTIAPTVTTSAAESIHLITKKPQAKIKRPKSTANEKKALALCKGISESIAG